MTIISTLKFAAERSIRSIFRSTTFRRTKFLVLISFVFNPHCDVAFAGEVFELYTGVRQMAMGGAYVCTANDETAILTNPAGLGKIRDTTFTILDPEISYGTEGSSLINSQNYKTVNSIEGLRQEQLKDSNWGKHFHAKGQVFPSVVTSNFGFGLLAKRSLDMGVNAAGTSVRIDYFEDYAAALAYNLRFWDGIVKVGISTKVIDRSEIRTDRDPTAVIDPSTIIAEGLGVSATAGLVLTAPIQWLPSIGATVHNIGHTAYTLSDGSFNTSGNRRPLTTEQSVDAAFSLSPILGRGVRMSITGEMHDLANISKYEDSAQLIHGGVEFNIADFVFLRGGYNQRYWTAGLEFATEHFQLQATSYGEEIGTKDLNKEDRRYVGKIAIRY